MLAERHSSGARRWRPRDVARRPRQTVMVNRSPRDGLSAGGPHRNPAPVPQRPNGGATRPVPLYIVFRRRNQGWWRNHRTPATTRVKTVDTSRRTQGVRRVAEHSRATRAPGTGTYPASDATASQLYYVGQVTLDGDLPHDGTPFPRWREEQEHLGPLEFIRPAPPSYVRGRAAKPAVPTSLRQHNGSNCSPT